MKRYVPASLLAALLLLGSGDIWYGVVDPDYAAIMGTWNVDLTTRPLGWFDTQYVFTEDRELEIYYGTELAYKGDVTNVENEDISVTATYKKDGGALDTMLMCYVLSNEDKNMSLGWFSGNDPVYYLDLTRE